MRRVSSRPATLVLVALVAVGAGAPTASASDAGLRKLVRTQQATEKRTIAKVKAAGGRVQTSSTLPEYRRRVSRYTRSLGAIYRQQARSDDRYRARFRAQAPQTTDAKRGRALMLQGLRDDATDLRAVAVRLRGVERQVRRVRSEAQIRGVVRAFDRALASKTGARAGRRLKRGRTLIRNAPAVPVPTPAPTAPPVTTGPPAPPAITPPAPPSFLPGL